MNIFSVHSNLIPVSGDITQRQYHPGRFFNAELDKASQENKRCAISIHMDNVFMSVVFRLLVWLHGGY
jgi:phosphatidylserine decarboxylase